MKHIVISGADGFIGTHLCQKCSALGIGVTAIVIPESPVQYRIENLPHVQIVQWDFENPQDILPCIPVEADAFFHLSWAGVAPNCRNDFALQQSNISVTIHALELAALAKSRKFVLPGSTSEYMYSDILTESNVPTPQNLYGATKIAVRYLCQCQAVQWNIPFIYTICTGIYGADRRDNNVITYTIETLLRGEIPQLTALEQKWDYVHIDDVIGAFVVIAEKGVGGRVYPVGAGDNQPLSEYILQIRDIINPELPLGLGAVPYATTNKLPASCIDTSILQKDTGFVAKIPFSQGIQGVIAKMKETR